GIPLSTHPFPTRRSSDLLGAPARWLGRQSVVAQDLAGGGHGLEYLRNVARGNNIRRRATFDNVDDGAPPVLLIHGFLGTRGSMIDRKSTRLNSSHVKNSY